MDTDDEGCPVMPMATGPGAPPRFPTVILNDPDAGVIGAAVYG